MMRRRGVAEAGNRAERAAEPTFWRWKCINVIAGLSIPTSVPPWICCCGMAPRAQLRELSPDGQVRLVEIESAGTGLGALKLPPSRPWLAQGQTSLGCGAIARPRS